MKTDKVRRLLKRNHFVEICADVNLVYGGIFVRPSSDSVHSVPAYYDVIRITDLDSACGADGQNLVESLNTAFCYGGKKSLKSAVYFIGGLESLREIAKRDKPLARLVLASWLVEYGVSDPNGYGANTFVAVTDRESEKDAREKWTDNRVEGYGMSALYRAVEKAIDLC